MGKTLSLVLHGFWRNIAGKCSMSKKMGNGVPVQSHEVTTQQIHV